jgi:IS30 family transposase
MLVKVPRSDSKTVVDALTRKEMASHKTFSLATDIRVYFCDPASPWQCGSTENTNGLPRQYFRKRTDLSGYSQAYLDRVALKLNQRPRETLGFDTPANKLHACVAPTRAPLHAKC